MIREDITNQIFGNRKVIKNYLKHNSQLTLSLKVLTKLVVGSIHY